MFLSLAHVLGVFGAEVVDARALRFLLVLRTGVDAQVLHLLTAQRTARDHALDRLGQHALGVVTVEDLVHGALLDPTGVAGVPVVGLGIALVAGQADLLGVDDHDVIAAIHVRGVGRLVLAAQDVGHAGGVAKLSDRISMLPAR